MTTPEERAVIDAVLKWINMSGNWYTCFEDSGIPEAAEALKAATSRQPEPAVSDEDIGCPVLGDKPIVPPVQIPPKNLLENIIDLALDGVDVITDDTIEGMDEDDVECLARIFGYQTLLFMEPLTGWEITARPPRVTGGDAVKALKSANLAKGAVQNDRT